ncbi:hypothetical protein EON67_01040 [archaeon]|nr:MAG: hypothetical protein EON67_01040 [archaeon]
MDAPVTRRVCMRVCVSCRLQVWRIEPDLRTRARAEHHHTESANTAAHTRVRTRVTALCLCTSALTCSMYGHIKALVRSRMLRAHGVSPCCRPLRMKRADAWVKRCTPRLHTLQVDAATTGLTAAGAEVKVFRVPELLPVEGA